MRTFTANVRLSILRLSALVAAAVFTALALAHSVGQVQTTKFFAPDTINLLRNRVNDGGPAGFRVGDVVTYIIQFTPVQNNATVGAGGYITDYIPPGVEVVGVDFVDKDASGVYYTVPPRLPGGIDDGFGDRGTGTHLAPFNVTTYDAPGRCASRPAGQCYGRMKEIYADTGIFYSTDPLTAAFPPLPTRIAQSSNGYLINPTAANALNTILGQSVATTHNLWDADQTNAFGTTAVPGGTPKSSVLPIGNGGQGTTPYYAGSAVAGPQTGYPLDNTAQVGPWQRIAYPGSRIGDPTTGPATAAELSETAVAGFPTALGRNVSLSNPLPPGTNAVRWAAGKLVVGQINYVRIKLRITQPVPAEGITNSSEVFGGDAGDSGGLSTNGGQANNGQDNAWRYHVPSVADNNSNLYVEKIACVYDPNAAICVPLTGAFYPAESTITYRITYFNTGNAVQTNVVLTDILPCQTVASTVVKIGSSTGPITSLLSALPVNITSSAITGNCASPQARSTAVFPTIPSMGSAGSATGGGSLILNILNNATTIANPVVNTVKMTSAALPGGVTSNAVTFVGDAVRPSLLVTKSSLNTTTVAGGTAQYTIVVKNNGTGPASNILIADVLPSMGGTPDATTRFNYATGTAVISSSGLTTTTAVVTSSNTSALFTPAIAAYDTAPTATNTVQVRWNFGTGSSLAVNGIITLTFTANVGSAMAATPTPYVNNAIAVSARVFTDFIDPFYRADAVAPITIQGDLSVSKTLEGYYIGSTFVPANANNTFPPNSKVRYRVDYANTGGGVLSNVVLIDTLPCQISATVAPKMTVTAVTGPIGGTLTLPLGVDIVSGTCPSVRSNYTFTAVPLTAGQTGSLSMEVQLTTPATISNVVVNDVKLSSGSLAATAQTLATIFTNPNLQISKTANPSYVVPGGTLSYTLTVTNVGTTAAQTITVFDWLPTGTSTVANDRLRFNYVTGSSVVTGSLTNVTPSVTTPTQAPYTSSPFAANQQELVWSFGAQTLAVGASASIVITVIAGTDLLALAPPNYYYNNAKVSYFNGQQASSNAAAANVSLVADLRVTKTNGTTTLVAGSTTNYTVTFSNFGPSAANGATVTDAFSAGLSCTTVTCMATTGSPTLASCPSPLVLNTPVASAAYFGAGLAIPTFPANSSVTLVVNCTVTATGQ
jgi:uncharacterized repeat protein (TIGR01451 family)